MWIEPDGTVTMIDVMDKEETRYYSRRTYDERMIQAKRA